MRSTRFTCFCTAQASIVQQIFVDFWGVFKIRNAKKSQLDHVQEEVEFRFSVYGAASVEQGCASSGGETRSDTSVSASLTPEEPRGCSRVLSFRQDPPFGILR